MLEAKFSTIFGIMKYILSLVFLTFISAQAFASDALVTIRFQNGNVAYQDKLFTAVSEAVKVKSSVIFSVVGDPLYSPQVANDIVRIGVNPAQVQIDRSAPSAGEVRIFVR